MGKAKKRNFHTCINNSKQGCSIDTLPSAFSRDEAISLIIQNVKDNNFSEETKDIISLFGITAEELAEAGASYEELLAFKSVFLL